MNKKRVIFITDGDKIAKHIIEEVAEKIGGRCISHSAGNPSPYTGTELTKMIMETPYDPVLIMFDDNGQENKGNGEATMEFVANQPMIDVIGALAVASNTQLVDGAMIDFSIDYSGRVVRSSVNKQGNTVEGPLRVYGDTVDILNRLDIPVIVGIGDIGKMGGHDHIKRGAPITLKAVESILNWGEKNEEKHETKTSWT